MSIAAFAVAQAAVAQPVSAGQPTHKPPPKRTILALTDSVVIPEPR